MRRTASAYIVVFSVCGLLLQGCGALILGGAAAGVGAGTVAYIKGELKSTESVDIATAWRAGKQTLEDMGFVITREDRDAVKGKLVALGVDNRKIRIKFERKGDHVTEVNIRVGTLGDEEVSRLILSKMRERY